MTTDELFEKIESFAEYEANFDGEGSPAIEPAAIDRAKTMLPFLELCGGGFRVVPGVDGGIVFDRTDESGAVEVRIHGDSAAAMFAPSKKYLAIINGLHRLANMMKMNHVDCQS